MNKIKNYNGYFDQGENWGMATAINLYNCNPDKVRSKDYIVKFAQKICKIIDMKAYGDPLIINFGDDEKASGYTLVQLIETSNINAHFVNISNVVYLDIFSCKWFDPQVAEEFSKNFFEAYSSESRSILR